MSFLSGLATQPATLAVGAGLLAGAVTGTAVVASGVLSSPAPAELALVSCPGNDTVVARVSSGQSILVTAKSGDGAWLELYIGEPGVDTGWAPVNALKFTESVDSLPVDGSCSAVAVASTGPADTFAATPGPTPTPLPPGVTPTPFVPTPIPTATPKPTPTPKVTPLPPGVTPTPFVATPLPPPPTIPPPTPTPTPTAVPTAAPDLTPPSITGVSITGAWTSGNGNYYIYAPAAVNCPNHSATISATVTDTGGSGLAGFTVHLHWKDPNGVLYDQQMSYNLTTHLYNKTINAVNGWAENAYIEYWITASDNANNSTATTHPPTNSLWLFTGQCLN